MPWCRMRFGAAIVVAAVASAEVAGAWAALSPSPSLRGINARRSSNCRRLHSVADSGEICSPEQSQASPKHTETYWTLPRLYVGSRRDMPNNLSLASGAIIPLSPDQTHYLTNVMRIFKKRKGKRKDGTGDDYDIDTRECVRIFNGKDGEWLAKVGATSDHRDEPPDNTKRRKRTKQTKDISLVAECIQQLQTQDSSDDDRPWVLFAPLKKQPRMKAMIEKSTELGVGRLMPVASDRTEGGAVTALLGSKISDVQMDAVYGRSSPEENKGGFDKLEVQAIEAAEQCERLGVPAITKDLPWNKREGATDSLWKVDEVVKQWCRDSDTPDGRALLICRERGSDRAVPVLQALRDNPRAAFLVGPEGGWSAEEEAVFDEVCSAYRSSSDAPVRGVSLGSTVLRAETACMLAVGAWSLMNDS